MAPPRRLVRPATLIVLATAVALAAPTIAPAAQSHLTRQQAARIRASLRREVKRHPGVVRRTSFIKRASLVNFTLPVTLRLRPPRGSTPPSTATADLGASLGSRKIALGGKLAAEIQFHDSFDGGALGNVDLKILPSSSKYLLSSSIPLLWNSDLSDPGTRFDAAYAQATAATNGIPNTGALRQGCGDFTSAGRATASARRRATSRSSPGWTPSTR